MRKVNECPKGIGLVSNFINILGEKKNVIDFLIDFYIFYKSDIKTFLRIKFDYKLGCTLRLQLYSIIFLLDMTNPSLGSIFFLYPPCLQTFQKINNYAIN